MSSQVKSRSTRIYLTIFFYFLMVCLARIGCVHRLNPSWEFLDYRLDLRVYHGTMLIREAHSSTFQVLGSTGAHIFNGFTVSWFWQQIADLTWSLPFFKAQLILSKIYNLQILHGHLLPLIYFSGIRWLFFQKPEHSHQQLHSMVTFNTWIDVKSLPVSIIPLEVIFTN